MPAQGAGAPLLESELAESDASPFELHPSAPPDALTPQELQELAATLPAGSASLPTEQALRSFRSATAGKVVWAEQMRELASRDGGSHFLREAYERQLLLDPESLTAADGPWAQAVPSAPPAEGAPGAAGATAAQALLNQVVVIRFDGRVANISVNASQKWLGIGHQAASRFGDCVFDPNLHILLGVGQATTTLQPSQTVKLTGLVDEPELNGKVGRIVSIQDDLEIALPQGIKRFRKDNVVPHNFSVVSRSVAFQLNLDEPAETSVLRVLWLERTPNCEANRALAQGPMRSIGAQYVGMSARQESLVSLGEFRNFLWNLHLDDSNFAVVSKRFAPSGDYIDYQELLFLLGRSHLRSKEVPVDALIYEAVVSILGRQTTAHIDRDLGAEDRGIGKRNACQEHCASYTTSLILEAVIWLNILAFLFLLFVDNLDTNFDASPELLLPAAIAYVIYLSHLACCVRLTRAFNNQTTGIEDVLYRMEQPRGEHPHYRWHVQCYHYRTRTRTRTDKDGRTQTYTERERVNTHSASATGIIPSQDHTEEFIPNTLAAQTQIVTKLELDLSSSNYMAEYHRWKNFHRRDIHQDSSHSEDLPSRYSSCLAIWSERNMPCWLNAGCYWLANFCAMSFLYRLLAQARIGSQEYVYLKKCFHIQSRYW